IGREEAIKVARFQSAKAVFPSAPKTTNQHIDYEKVRRSGFELPAPDLVPDWQGYPVHLPLSPRTSLHSDASSAQTSNRARPEILQSFVGISKTIQVYAHLVHQRKIEAAGTAVIVTLVEVVQHA